MSDTIATINTMLVANALGFIAGCKQAENAAKGLESGVSGIAEHLTGIAEAIGLAEAGAKLTEFVAHSIETIEQTKHMADVLGVSTEAFGKLAYAAKLTNTDTETLSGGLTKLLKNMNEAANGTGPAAAAFARLGLNAKELSQVPVDQAFGRIGDRLKEVTDPSERVRDAIDLMGRSGAQLLPLLDQGSDGLKKFGDEAVKLGVALNDTDAEKVELAGQSMKRVQSLVEGLGNTLAVSLAPYIEGVADALLDAGVNGSSMSDRITSGVEMVAEGIAEASGTIDLIKAGWEAFAGTVQGGVAAMLIALKALADPIAKIANLLGADVDLSGLDDAIETYTESAKQNFEDAGQSLSDMANGKRAQDVRDFFDNVKNHASESAKAAEETAHRVGHVSEEAIEGSKKIVDQIEKLKEQVAEFGKTDSQKLADKMKAEGASPEQIAQATALQNQIDKMKEVQKAHDDAASAARKYYEETRTPAEKYSDELQHINDLVTQGALDAETAARAKAKAAEDLANSTKDTDDDRLKDKKDRDAGPAKLLQAGSQEAASFLASFQRQSGSDPKQEEARKSNRKLDTTNDYLKRLYDIANSGGSNVLGSANLG